MPPDSAPRRSSRGAPRTLLIVAAMLLAARAGVALWEQGHPPQARDHDLVNWRTIAAGETEARATGRPVLYEFSAEWCGPCKLLETEVFQDAPSAARLNDLTVPVHVVDRAREDGHNRPEVHALLERFGVDAFPTLVLLDPRTGRHETIAGYAGRDALLREITRLAQQLGTAPVPGDDHPTRH